VLSQPQPLRLALQSLRPPLVRPADGSARARCVLLHPLPLGVVALKDVFALAGLDGIERLLERARKLVVEGKDLREEFGKDLKR